MGGRSKPAKSREGCDGGWDIVLARYIAGVA